jgi:hypothetical protein
VGPSARAGHDRDSRRPRGSVGDLGDLDEVIRYAAEHDPDRIAALLEWDVEDFLLFTLGKLRADASAGYRFAVARYDVDRLVYTLGGLKDKPKPPTLPALLKSL